MKSLRLRVALASAAVIGLTLSGGGLGVELIRRHALQSEFAEVVRSRLHGVAADCEFEEGKLERHRRTPDSADEAWVVRYGEAVADGSPWLPEPPDGATLEHPWQVAIEFPDGGHGMAAGAWFDAEDDHHSTGRRASATVAVRSDILDRQLATLRATLLFGGLGVAVLAATALALVLGRLLRPHALLADAIAGLDPRRAGQRLPVDGMPAELRPVAERINDLCDRLERAYGLAASFHAVAAHELRTPLAGLRATIEVAQGNGGSPTAALAACHQIALRMQARIDNLLMAARIDAGQMRPQRDEIDLHDLLRQAWDGQAERVGERGLVVRWDLAGSGLVEGDVEALRMVISNLIDNAISHTPGTGGIGITTREAGGWTELVVDNATALDPADAERVFDRGWRSRTAAAGEARHAGLGMSITRELVGLMRGRISVSVSGGRFAVAIALPAPGEFSYW